MGSAMKNMKQRGVTRMTRGFFGVGGQEEPLGTGKLRVKTWMLPETNQARLRRKSSPGRENSVGKGPEVGSEHPRLSHYASAWKAPY